ncbi:histidine ammonia-lyase [Plakobranchus ocellatus]|uniref:Histidine ammonia-lyase n=1 Tax=Plakobranchus ocellatus TaxID=259542 RepID=A0AAV4DEZ7_9GAST|nr:histidine ammonia-lyase [Plakobranchus ocellatus]
MFSYQAIITLISDLDQELQKGGVTLRVLGSQGPRPKYAAGLHKEKEYLALDGDSLSTDDLLRLGRGQYYIKLTDEAKQKVIKARNLVEDLVASNKPVYGVTTGFGKFANKTIAKDKLVELQENLIRSHAAGVGSGLSPERTKMLLALRINVLAKGYSGISLETLEKLIAAFNASCLPWVPEQGTVGASGDLAPLSHLALGMIGEGKMWSPKSGWAEAKFVLESHNLTPIKLKPKEGISLINGTQLITSIGCEALERSEAVARQADVIAALTLEVLKGTSRAFDSKIHAARPHKGQIKVAHRMRGLLHSETYSSEVSESHRFCNRVQDAYTLRCCPQVHGIVDDTLEFVRTIISTELNSATDNPMVFADMAEIVSGGNFHGEYPAKALDYMAIAIHELSSMSERRIERLVNPGPGGDFQANNNLFDNLITGDETWFHLNTPETKRDSMTWKHPSSPVTKKFKVQRSAAKVMATVFWDAKGVILLDILPQGQCINAARYCSTLDRLKEAIRRKRPGLLRRGVVLQHDNATPHSANLTQQWLQRYGWEILPHPAHSPDLAPSDFHLFGLLKRHLGGMAFETEDDLISELRNWFDNLDVDFFRVGINSLLSRWQKCIDLHGDYVEK